MPALRDRGPLTSIPFITPAVIEPGPYLDYSHRLTAEGGILIIYKDLDLHWRHWVWRVFGWCVFTGLEGWLLLGHSPVQNDGINGVALMAMAALNAFIVWKPIEVYRSIEIRPDGIILEGEDVFWLSRMESLPSFSADENGNQVLSGIYGTRFVEYLTARRFDEYDRMPEVIAARVQQAMRQLWASILGPDQFQPRRKERP
jgi:hypothetical protein